jgi:hypothetical protein
MIDTTHLHRHGQRRRWDQSRNACGRGRTVRPSHGGPCRILQLVRGHCHYYSGALECRLQQQWLFQQQLHQRRQRQHHKERDRCGREICHIQKSADYSSEASFTASLRNTWRRAFSSKLVWMKRTTGYHDDDWERRCFLKRAFSRTSPSTSSKPRGVLVPAGSWL